MSPELIYFRLVLNIGNYLLASMVLSLTVLWRKSHPEALLHAFLSALGAWLLAQFIKEIFPTPRPFVINGFAPPGFDVHSASGSFPSGHSAAAFAFGVAAFLHNGPVGTLMLIGSVAVGLSRILGNVHYPVDIVGGAILGIVTSVVLFRLHVQHLFRYLSKSRSRS